MIELGCGLIGIGRPWGYAPTEVPDDSEARTFLECAYELGIRLFDTAPSYGDTVSERRLGAFVRSLTPSERNGVTVATKFGEHWNPLRNAPYVDHSLEALQRSLDASIARLGRIEVLQLHKTTPQTLASDDLGRAWAYARSLGISTIGASVSDLESARLTLADRRYSVIQMPLHEANLTFENVLAEAGHCGVRVFVNRPFNMGSILYAEDTVDKHKRRVGAFTFLLRHGFHGAILTGTKSARHLRENWLAFQQALIEASDPA